MGLSCFTSNSEHILLALSDVHFSGRWSDTKGNSTSECMRSILAPPQIQHVRPSQFPVTLSASIQRPERRLDESSGNDSD